MTSYKQRIEEILHVEFKDKGTPVYRLIDINEATTHLLALMDEFGDEVIGPDMPRKVEYFDKVEQQNVYSNELDLTRRTQNELRRKQRTRKKELLK